MTVPLLFSVVLVFPFLSLLFCMCVSMSVIICVWPNAVFIYTIIYGTQKFRVSMTSFFGKKFILFFPERMY